MAVKFIRRKCARNILPGLFVDHAAASFSETVSAVQGAFHVYSPVLPLPTPLRDTRDTMCLAEGHRAGWWQAGTGTSSWPPQGFLARTVMKSLNVSIVPHPPRLSIAL